MAVDYRVDPTGQFLHRLFAQQPWYRQNANTITTAGGFIATVAAWVATSPFSDNPHVQSGLVLVGFLLTVLGVRFTPNGLSQSQMNKIAEAQAEYVDSTPLLTPEEKGEPVTGETLDAMVRNFIKKRE